MRKCLDLRNVEAPAGHIRREDQVGQVGLEFAEGGESTPLRHLGVEAAGEGGEGESGGGERVSGGSCGGEVVRG